VQSYICCGDFS